MLNKFLTENSGTTQAKKPYIHSNDHVALATYTGLMSSFTKNSEFFLKKCFLVHVLTLSGHHEAASVLNCPNISKGVTFEELLLGSISKSGKEAA